MPEQNTTHRTAMMVGLIVAVSMTSIDQTIVALTGPTIQKDLGITHGPMQWAVNVYLIATAAFFLLGGRLSDVLGHRRMALIGIAAFGSTSLLCGLAPEGDYAGVWLIGARALQGVAGALMYPAAIGLVVQTFPRAGRAGAMARFFAITGAMTALGPIAGGYLSVWTWRSVFWVNVPLAIVGLVLVRLAAPRSEPRSEPIDLPGAAIVAAAFGVIVFGLQQAGSWGWTDPWIIASLITGAALLIVFCIVELRTEHPLVRLAVFRDRSFTIANTALLLASIAFVSTFFFLSVYGQVSLQLSALNTGLLFLKLFIGFVVASQIGARRFDQLGGRTVLLFGGVIGFLGFFWLSKAVITIPDNPADFMNSQTLPIMLAGAGIGFMLSSASTDAVNRAIGASYGEVTAISQTMRNLGGALGLAVLSTVVTQSLTTRLTASFTALGAPASAAADAVAQIGGASSSSSSSSLPAAVQAQYIQAVQQGYAEAVSHAFAGSAIAMAAVAVVSLLYTDREKVRDVLGVSAS
ncbi:MFS transporter [Acidipropionibacterium thoenii]|uniref:MFS transporter n=1 Tax=Acidipropionibacterium thoenii TaxID=1751 RepID=UPI000409DA9E|nr:MFS transporter [Acidipropionibacterium thoenii]